MPPDTQYHACRWYDPYPRLAFAMKLLDVAPQHVRSRAWDYVLAEIDACERAWQADHHEGDRPWREDQAALDGAWLLAGEGQRHYDQEARSVQALFKLKQAPESLKLRLAEGLLRLLETQPPV